MPAPTSSTLPTFSAVREYPAAPPAEVCHHALARLAAETDVGDVIHDLSSGTGNIVVLDVRSPTDYEVCHVPGAISLPHRRIGPATTAGFDRDALFVVYCWGPACNASTKAAAKLAELGFQVKEMLGGIEYWRLEGCPVEGTLGKEAPLYWQHAP